MGALLRPSACCAVSRPSEPTVGGGTDPDHAWRRSGIDLWLAISRVVMTQEAVAAWRGIRHNDFATRPTISLHGHSCDSTGVRGAIAPL